MGQRWSNSLQRFHFFDGTFLGRWYPKGLPLSAWYLKGLSICENLWNHPLALALLWYYDTWVSLLTRLPNNHPLRSPPGLESVPAQGKYIEPLARLVTLSWRQVVNILPPILVLLQAIGSKSIQASRIVSLPNPNSLVLALSVIKYMKQNLNRGCEANVSGGINSLPVILVAAPKRPSNGNTVDISGMCPVFSGN